MNFELLLRQIVLGGYSPCTPCPVARLFVLRQPSLAGLLEEAGQGWNTMKAVPEGSAGGFEESRLGFCRPERGNAGLFAFFRRV